MQSHAFPPSFCVKSPGLCYAWNVALASMAVVPGMSAHLVCLRSINSLIEAMPYISMCVCVCVFEIVSLLYSADHWYVHGFECKDSGH